MKNIIFCTVEVPALGAYSAAGQVLTLLTVVSFPCRARWGKWLSLVAGFCVTVQPRQYISKLGFLLLCICQWKFCLIWLEVQFFLYSVKESQWGGGRSLGQRLADFSCKGPVVNILDFVGHKISVMTIELCCWNMKAAIANIQMNGHSCVLIRLYL